MKRQLLVGLGVATAALAFTATAASAHAASVSCVAGLVRVHNDFQMVATVTLDDGRQMALPSSGRVDFPLGAAHTYSVRWTDAFAQGPRPLPVDCKPQTTTTTVAATTTTTSSTVPPTTSSPPETTVAPTTVPEVPTTVAETVPAPILGPPVSIVRPPTTVATVAAPTLPATGRPVGGQAIIALALLASGTALVVVARKLAAGHTVTP